MDNDLAASSLLPPSKLPFFKKQIALVIGEILSKLSARHVASWSQALALGDRAGFTRGKRHGSLEGYAEGFTAGRLVLEIKDFRDRVDVRPGIDDFLFEDWKLPVTEAIELRMRADVLAFMPKHKQPTKDQWKMIFSKTPSTYVIAGAGSGKSTTLILRILLLHHYLGFELGSMTVVTFTKMSQIDFVKKLRETMQIWGIPISEATANAVVCTFHSKILTFVRALNDDKIVPFEFFGDKKKEDPTAETLDSPFDTRINEHQRGLLNGCYTDLYSRVPRFRELIGNLYYHSLTLDARNLDSEVVKKRMSAIGSVAGRDIESMDLIEDAWEAAGEWPFDGVSAVRETIKVSKHSFQIHGRVTGMEDIAVILRADTFPGPGAVRPESKHPVVAEMAVKKTICDAYSPSKIVWVDKAGDLKTFIKWLANRSAFAPTFNYQVNGELASSPLLDCFVGAAAFIENLGLNVTDTVAEMKFRDDDPDRLFFETLGIFWPKFLEYLGNQTPRIMTFNQMFASFGEGCHENLRLVPDAVLRSMSQLMIDEFQDISPQIVSWVRGVMQEVRRRGQDLCAGRNARCSSLLCVGDDWQSIYGWRGSSPKYFLEFNDEFKSPDTTPIMLRENFRSHQHIIDAAECIVASAPSIPEKRARSSGTAANDPVAVQVRDQSDVQLRALATSHYEAGEDILVLYREGGTKERERIKTVLADIYRADRKLPKSKQRLRILTFHKSKGLEADTVFLLGDCRFKISSPYKNKVYKIAKLGDPDDPFAYDTSQKEELLRLAYVGITRAARHCYWFVEVAKAPSSKPKASDFLPKDVPYFHDLRSIR